MKTTKRVVTFRAEQELVRELRKAARSEGRLLSPFVRSLLRAALAMRQKDAAA